MAYNFLHKKFQDFQKKLSVTAAFFLMSFKRLIAVKKVFTGRFKIFLVIKKIFDRMKNGI